jgi:hypothetical protein
MFWPGPENCRTWPATRKHRISKSFFAIPPVESWGFEAQIRNFDWVKLTGRKYAGSERTSDDGTTRVMGFEKPCLGRF